MYPFLHLLPDGSLFIFTDRSSQLFDVVANQTIKVMPDLSGMHRTYPNTGGSVILPLRKANNYSAEIMICGGGDHQGIDSPCDASCGKITPLSSSPQWTYSAMPQPRGMVEAVLLLDGTVLWINGAQVGAQGFGIADSPALEALIYDPNTDRWETSGETKIARLYHSIALLLLDGTILIAGSNPNEMPVLERDCNQSNQYTKFPTDFRTEIWTPPYLRGEKKDKRPRNIQLSDKVLEAKTVLKMEFTLDARPKSVDIILYIGGFVTHSVHMGQVMVYLEGSGWTSQEDNKYLVTALMPTHVKLAPGPYVVYLVADGVPGYGQFVSLQI